MNRSLLLGLALGSAVTAAVFLALSPSAGPVAAAPEPSTVAPTRVYENTLTPIRSRCWPTSPSTSNR